MRGSIPNWRSIRRLLHTFDSRETNIYRVIDESKLLAALKKVVVIYG